MTKTSEATLRAIRKYKEKLDEVRFSVREGGKADIVQAATDKGFKSTQSYLKHLLKQDTGLDL